MPTYRITAPDGKVLRITGDSPPTEKELEQIFSKTKSSVSLAERAISGSIGGIIPAVGGARKAEEALPIVGQALGSLGGFPGAVLGATTGELVRRGISERRIPKPSEAIIPAVETAIIESVFRGGGKLLKPAVNRLMLSTLKPPVELIKKGAKPQLGLQAAEAKLVGSEVQILSRAEELISNSSDKLRGIIKRFGNRPVDMNAILTELGKMKSIFKDVGDLTSLKSINEVTRNITRRFKPGKAGTIPVKSAQRLKQSIDKVLKQSQVFKSTGEIPAKASARKEIARGLRRGIEKAIPEENIKEINRLTSLGMDVKEAISVISAREARNPMVSAIMERAVIPGTLATSVVRPEALAPGLAFLGTDIAFRIGSSPAFKTGLAANLLRLSKQGLTGTASRIGLSEAFRRSTQ